MFPFQFLRSSSHSSLQTPPVLLLVRNHTVTGKMYMSEVSKYFLIIIKCYRIKMKYTGHFEHANQFRISRYTYDIKCKQFHERKKRLIPTLVYQNSNVHSHVQRKWHSFCTSTNNALSFRTGFILISYKCGFWEHSLRKSNGGKKNKKQESKHVSKLCFET